MNLITTLMQLLIQIRNLIASLLSVFGLSYVLTVAVANFSLAAVAIVLFLIFPQIVILTSVLEKSDPLLLTRNDPPTRYSHPRI